MKSSASVVLAAASILACSCANRSDNPRDSFSLCEQQVRDSRNVHSIMVEDKSFGADARWQEKEVKESRVLDMTLPGTVSLLADATVAGYASLHMDSSVTHSGNGSIRLDCAASTARKKDTNRNYGTPEILCSLGGEDLTEWNRISCWVYVDAPGYYNAFLGFKLHNEGEHIEPVPGRFEGEHCFTAIPGEWTRITWEVQDIYRDKVKGISASIMMMGETSSSASGMSLYLDDLRIEKVDTDNSRGFGMRPGTIAYSQSGYRTGACKQAVFQSSREEPIPFTVVDSRSRRTAFRGRSTYENGFHTADFSSLDKPGLYYIKVKDRETFISDVFPIGKDAFKQSAWRGINYFFSERCGADIPGVHEACHTDIVVKHPDGRCISWVGGWHDAADVSQGPGNNNEAIVGMLELAEKTDDVELRERALEEARWGLNWQLRTRFGDGFRAPSLIVGIWTDNIFGSKDDMWAMAVNNPVDNFRCAESFAMAAPVFEEIDPVFARWCRNAAIEDFGFASELFDAKGNKQVEANAFAAASAMRLYEMTGEKRYADYAAERMDVVLACLETEARPDWSMPVRGYFYEDTSRSRILAFFHQSQEHKPAQVLRMLLNDCPDHPDAAAWKAACEAMADWYLVTKDIAAPYGLSPAAIYEVDNTDYSNLYHEGERVGLPSLEEYNAEVRNGVALSDSAFIRKFPVAYQFRGFNGVTLAKAKTMFILSDVVGSKELRDIATRQLEWVVGFNPFAASTIYGDGYEYHPLYGAYAGNVVGACPVGIETFEVDDEPYWPTQVNATYKEIWMHTTARLLSVISELD